MRDFKKTGSFGKRSFGPKRPRAFGGGGRDFDRPLEMHQAECNECHKMCEVPFRPNGKKPVYCRDCFKTQERDSGSSNSFSRDEAPRSFHSRPEGGSGDDLKKQFNVLNTKLDRLTAAIEAQTRALTSKE